MLDLPVRYTASDPPGPIIFILLYMSNLFKEVEIIFNKCNVKANQANLDNT